MRSIVTTPLALLFAILSLPALASGQDPRDLPGRPGPEGRGGPQGPGGPGGPGGERETAVLETFDADRDGSLNREERTAARQWLQSRPRRGPGGPGGPPGFGRGGRRGPEGRDPGDDSAPTTPSEPTRLTPDQVESFPDHDLYDPTIVRTIFLEFPDEDWFEELSDFYRTDVEVPATMRVDGKVYRDVGVGFRGNSSYFAAPGRKKSFAISVDAKDEDASLQGYRNLNFLNCHADPSFLREVLHAFLAQPFVATMQANVVRVVVNGESFGVFANVQQFDKTFLEREFGTRKGVRWKVPANPRGGGGLAWLGEDAEPYQRAYQLKSKVDDEGAAWNRLIALCRAIEDTPEAELEQSLPKILDVDATLWFLALDAVTLDGDGYMSRASDFILWESPDGRFRPIPYDSNEILGAGGPGAGMPGRGPGGGQRRGRGPGGPMGGAQPTSGPLAILESSDRPLARLLRVPAWRAAYLAHVRTLVTRMDWATVGPLLEDLHARIEPLVRVDEKAHTTFEQFRNSLTALRTIIETRRRALLEHADLGGTWPGLRDVTVVSRTRDDGQAELVARATTTGDAAIGSVLLQFATKRRGPFLSSILHDDGLHDDGAKGDGVFGGVGPAHDARERVWWYLEVRTATTPSLAAFEPAGASTRPAVVEPRPR